MRILLSFLLLFFTSSALASGNAELFAQNIDTNQTHIKASGSVLIFYEDQVIGSNEAYYNRDNEMLELKGNITMLKGAEFQIMGQYLQLNSKIDEKHIKPFYLLSKEEKVWISAATADVKEDNYDLSSGVVSGCEPSNPIWSIHFSSSDYSDESQWMNLYNARLYFKKVPVFYSPYLGYSLDDRRRSGLLLPFVGVSSDEGFYYQQPLYIAPYDSWDLELSPQIRTNRGRGIYGTLRFVDSHSSHGELNLGYFKEQEEYAQKFDLANEEHFGFTFKYENSNWLKEYFGVDSAGQSGLDIDAMHMNDIDYLNLNSNNPSQNVTSNQIFSRANLFYSDDNNYIGSYFKYYLDLNKEDNNDTIQNLPIVQYHRYIDTILDDHLLYSFNANYTSHYRTEGSNAEQIELTVPLTLQSTFLDNYIDVAYRAEGIAKSTKLSNDIALTDTQKKGEFLTLAQSIDVGTYLLKPYEDFSHALSFTSAYSFDVEELRKGYYEDAPDACSEVGVDKDLCAFYTTEEKASNLALNIIQYLFDDSGNQFLYHRLSQRVFTNTSALETSELESELDYKITKQFSLYNDTFYNYDYARVTKSINTLKYAEGTINSSLSFLYEDTFTIADEEIQIEYSRYVTLDATYVHDKHYRYFGKYAYDIEAEISKSAEIGFLYTKRCWDFGLKYVENNRPILSGSGTTSSVYDKYVYLTVALKPITEIEFNYKLSEPIQAP